jgi:hypothetical protein
VLGCERERDRQTKGKDNVFVCEFERERERKRERERETAIEQREGYLYGAIPMSQASLANIFNQL